MQQSMEGMVQCPHCAHNSQRGYFGTHSQVAGVAQVRRRVSQTQPLAEAQAPIYQPQAFYVPTPQPAAWSGHQPVMEHASANITRPMLQASQALMPTGAPPPPNEFTTPQHLRASPWRGAFILLAFIVVCGGATWLWWDQVNNPADALKAAKPAPSATDAAEIRKAQIAPKTEIKVIATETLDMNAISADVKTLVEALFTADSPAGRAASIHEAERHGVEIEAFFAKVAAEKIERRVLSLIPGMPLHLPGGQPMPLFKLVTSKCIKGALIRLETGSDGKRRIFWPLFVESHDGALVGFAQETAAEPGWFNVGLRPSHGLDIPAELRSKYLTFDVQVSASSDPHFVACVERDTPLGRMLDRETEWGKAYLARLLMRKLDIRSDASCFVVLDCEGAKEK